MTGHLYQAWTMVCRHQPLQEGPPMHTGVHWATSTATCWGSCTLGRPVGAPGAQPRPTAYAPQTASPHLPPFAVTSTATTLKVLFACRRLFACLCKTHL